MNLNNLNKKHGGARSNSGPAKGVKYAKTLKKEEAREHVRQVITGHVEEMLAAQIKNAIRIRHLLMRDPATGKLRRVGSDISDAELTKAQIDGALKAGNAFWIYTKDPSVQAFTDLMNRAFVRIGSAHGAGLGQPLRERTIPLQVRNAR